MRESLGPVTNDNSDLTRWRRASRRSVITPLTDNDALTFAIESRCKSLTSFEKSIFKSWHSLSRIYLYDKSPMIQVNS